MARLYCNENFPLPVAPGKPPLKRSSVRRPAIQNQTSVRTGRGAAGARDQRPHAQRAEHRPPESARPRWQQRDINHFLSQIRPMIASESPGSGLVRLVFCLALLFASPYLVGASETVYSNINCGVTYPPGWESVPVNRTNYVALVKSLDGKRSAIFQVRTVGAVNHRTRSNKAPSAIHEAGPPRPPTIIAALKAPQVIAQAVSPEAGGQCKRYTYRRSGTDRSHEQPRGAALRAAERWER